MICPFCHRGFTPSPEEIKEVYKIVGAMGGRKGKRTLTHEQAVEMARKSIESKRKKKEGGV